MRGTTVGPRCIQSIVGFGCGSALGHMELIPLTVVNEVAAPMGLLVSERQKEVAQILTAWHCTGMNLLV